MEGRSVGFIKWRLGVIQGEIIRETKRASKAHSSGNSAKLAEAVTQIEKLKSEKASWYDKLAEAEMEE